MSGKSNMYLIGPMGSGKTAVGRQLARELELEFFDTDVEIEKRTGVDIAFIFEKEGEARFREREKNVIAELCALTNVVISTGGGAILDRESRERLASTGIVVYLKTSIDEQLKRTAQTKKRPLLANDNPRAVLERLIAEREPLYEQMADICVDTSGRRVASVAGTLRKQLKKRSALQK